MLKHRKGGGAQGEQPKRNLCGGSRNEYRVRFMETVLYKPETKKVGTNRKTLGINRPVNTSKGKKRLDKTCNSKGDGNPELNSIPKAADTGNVYQQKRIYAKGSQKKTNKYIRDTRMAQMGGKVEARLRNKNKCQPSLPTFQ